MNLVIDLGNTSAKLGFYENNILQAYHHHLKEAQIVTLVKNQSLDYVLISSVRSLEEVQALEHELELYAKVIVLNAETPVPIKKLYETPKTLGVDRVAAVVGAKSLYPNQACLVIDMGTSITYDIINETGEFLGGSISLGLQMRFKALHNFTARLPLIEVSSEEIIELTGKSTEKAIKSGVIQGIIFEVEGFIRKYKNIFPNFVTLLTGGDAPFFETKVEEEVTLAPKLTITGLNQILIHNIVDEKAD